MARRIGSSKGSGIKLPVKVATTQAAYFVTWLQQAKSQGQSGTGGG